MASPQFRALILTSLGHLAVSRGERAEAAAALEEALGSALSAKDMPVVARVGVGVADLWLSRGDRTRAATVLGAAERLRGLADRATPDTLRLTAALTGEPALARAYAQGRTLDRADALALLGRI